MAIVSLVTSLLCLVPVAVVTGILALVQLRRRHESGQGLAIAGLSVSAVVTVVAAGIFAASMFLPDFFSDTYHRGTAADVEGLVVGDCFSETGSAATAVDCADEHDGEIYFVGPVVADSVDEAQMEADDACYEEFEPYVGKDYDLSDFDYVFYAPDDNSWTQGDREFACAIVPIYTDSLQGSARDSGD